jgi:betaine-homocysteine S-methyltransferase
LRAGSDVIEAFTYYAHRSKLRVIGREHELESMNRQALRIAREVAKEGNALLAGNICNTWEYNPNDLERSSKVVRGMYEEQVKWAVEEGADFIIAETIEYIGEAQIALEVIKKYKMPAVVTLGPTYDKSKDGIDWIEGCKMLEANGADVVGFNCMRGPQTMLPLLRKLRKNVNCYIAALPVPYATDKEYPAFQFLKYDHKKAYPLYMELDRFYVTRYEMADFAKKAEEIGVNYIGVCCGGGPHHVRAMAEALGRVVPASKYSPDMTQHGLVGTDKVVKKHEKKFLKKWK